MRLTHAVMLRLFRQSGMLEKIEFNQYCLQFQILVKNSVTTWDQLFSSGLPLLYIFVGFDEALYTFDIPRSLLRLLTSQIRVPTFKPFPTKAINRPVFGRHTIVWVPTIYCTFSPQRSRNSNIRLHILSICKNRRIFQSIV